MEIKSKLSGLARKLKDHSVKTMFGLGLIGLVSITTLNDNVHLGSTTLINTKGNHYIYGLCPTTIISGTSEGDIRTYGIIINNSLKEKSTQKGNMNAYGLFWGSNMLKNNSQILGDMNAYGILCGLNELASNSQISGNMNAYGMIAGGTYLQENSTIKKGNITSRGIFAFTHMEDGGFLSNKIIGIKEYTQPYNPPQTKIKTKK